MNHPQATEVVKTLDAVEAVLNKGEDHTVTLLQQDLPEAIF